MLLQYRVHEVKVLLMFGHVCWILVVATISR